jgi:hypothetical protein
MELMLLGVTVVSLLVALVMSAAAWRASRAERVRSSARVAALAAAAADLSPSPRAEASAEIVDRPARAAEARAPWTSARVSSFAAPSRQPASAEAVARVPDLVLYPPTEAPSFRETPIAHEPVAKPAALADGFLGGSVSQPTGTGQRNLAVAAAVLFLLLSGGGYWMIFGDREDASTTAVAAGTSASAPLELVSLRHERNGARLAVSGLVRNPVAAGAVERLTAVVFLFDQQGGFVTSAKADVDFTKLAPGDESPFVISIDAPATVARYRVSFRTQGGIVPHIDRRGQDPVAPNTIGQNGHASTVR